MFKVQMVLRKNDEYLLQYPPWYWGRAYDRPWMCDSVWYPIPLNFVVRCWRWFMFHWYWVCGRPWQVEGYTVSKLKDVYDRGFQDGRTLGFVEGEKVGIQEGGDQLLKVFDALCDERRRMRERESK